MGDSHRRLSLHVQRNLWKVNPKGGTMFEFVTQHQFWPAVVIYWIFSAAVSSMPEPNSNGNPGYLWARPG